MRRGERRSVLTARGALLFAVVLLLTSSVALAASGPKDEKVRYVPADQARARSVNIRRADLPAGWTAEKGEPSTPLRCPGIFDPDFSRVTITATVDSPAFSNGFQFASSVAEVYETTAQLSLEWRLGTSAAATRCIRLDTKEAFTEPGLDAKVVSVAKLSVPRVAPRQAAWRFRVRLTETSSGQTGVLFVDLVVTARGRAVVGVVFGYPAFQRLSTAFAAKLVGAIGKRLSLAFP